MSDLYTPPCIATTVVCGDILCLEFACDHDGQDGEYCVEVREEQVCDTHSMFEAAESGWEEITHSEPWPCRFAGQAVS